MGFSAGWRTWDTQFSGTSLKVNYNTADVAIVMLRSSSGSFVSSFTFKLVPENCVFVVVPTVHAYSSSGGCMCL